VEGRPIFDFRFSNFDFSLRKALSRVRRTVGVHGSPNFNRRPEGATIDTLVIHYTALELAPSLEILSAPEAQVSTHFVIDRDGTICQLVGMADRAWHAGHSAIHGRADVNSYSVGIDLVFVPGVDEQYPGEQWAAMVDLVKALMRVLPIKSENVVGHEHVALPPGRKQDPGPLFDWNKLRSALSAPGHPGRGADARRNRKSKIENRKSRVA